MDAHLFVVVDGTRDVRVENTKRNRQNKEYRDEILLPDITHNLQEGCVSGRLPETAADSEDQCRKKRDDTKQYDCAAKDKQRSRKEKHRIECLALCNLFNQNLLLRVKVIESVDGQSEQDKIKSDSLPQRRCFLTAVCLLLNNRKLGVL